MKLKGKKTSQVRRLLFSKPLNQKKFVLLLGLSFFCFFGFAQQDVSVKLISEKNHPFDACVVVNPLNITEVEAKSKLQVFVDSEGNNSTPQIIGKYIIRKDSLIFQPLFPFSFDLKYRVELKGADPFYFHRPKPENRAPTFVKNIYPSTDTLPANLLKMYLTFSAPMSEGNAYENIHLLNAKGDTMADSFLELLPELWNEDQTRLTIWFDPGRIKRDLGPNNLLGLPLEKNQKYQLIINPKWQDKEGLCIKDSYRKHMLITKTDRKQTATKNWQIKSPPQYTSEALQIQFDEPLDFATAKKAFTILDANQNIIDGQVKLSLNETQLRFTPTNKWKSGTYAIKVSAILEDLAGNNLNRLFDRDLDREEEKRGEEAFYYLEFVVENR